MLKVTMVGIATCIPAIYCMFFMAAVFVAIVLDFGYSYGFMRNLVAVHIVCMLLNLSLLAFYLHDVYVNRKLSDKQRTLWMVLLILGNVIAMPVYWYRFFRKETKEGTDIENGM